jgi:hypothetical protein
MNYLNPADVVATRNTILPRNRNVGGYGCKIPSQWLLKIKNHWHRVYVIQYSNAGSAYILQKGQKVFLGGYEPK